MLFDDLGLEYSGRAEHVLSFGYISQNYFILDLWLQLQRLQGGKSAV